MTVMRVTFQQPEASAGSASVHQASHENALLFMQQG